MPMPTRILIADDNEVARGRLAESIENHDGWKVCAAVENGEQAVAKATELEPDIIILDLAMPVKDGLQATREIGRIMPAVPILIYTLHDASWLDGEAKKAGARRVVSKPNLEMLLSVLESLITKEPPKPVLGAGLAAATAADASASMASPHRSESFATGKGNPDTSRE